MKRKLAFLLIVILIPILAISQGVVKREKKETPKKEKTTTKKNTTNSNSKGKQNSKPQNLQKDNIQEFTVRNVKYKIANSSKSTVVLESWEDASGATQIPSTVSYNGVKYTVTEVGSKAFENCKRLVSLYLPNTVTKIGKDAFYGCSGLTRVDISDLEAWCNIDFENPLANPLYYAETLYFKNNLLTNLQIPETIKAIKNYTFEWCADIVSVEIPNTVTSIGERAFECCTSLTSITIPQSVTSIKYSAFSWCSHLTKINVDKNNPNYTSRDGILYSKKIDTLVCFPAGKKGNAKIPDSITSIGNGAFEGCTGLTDIEIPNSVTSIGDEAFRDCKRLTSIQIPNSVTSIGDDAFYDCTSLKSVSIPSRFMNGIDMIFKECPNLTDINGFN